MRRRKGSKGYVEERLIERKERTKIRKEDSGMMKETRNRRELSKRGMQEMGREKRWEGRKDGKERGWKARNDCCLQGGKGGPRDWEPS